jgi:uncharacterized protein (TIGR02118 family)
MEPEVRMVHLIFCLRRLPHLSREEFQRYWREQHAPLVAAHAAALGIRRYVQAHTVEHPIAQGAAAARGTPEPYDGVAELWFDTQELLERMQSEAGAEAARALLEDERRFLDLRRSPIFCAEDHVVLDG